ncbi:MerR family transcriptional regulator [Pseudoalteromonas shioyasakiensis]|uniref:MerR family transcriptional regulator n=1 Tax=Pseudoalteromonas shioyasakiensis TaxID=1190813 RepID=UPI001EFD498F|nr:MerR family transcriptional regulator [Pseudoalteromonas shioyasakiensis]MCG9733671.1 MerR family transcriptional regulator [Pseudoalteromonas shioyasakiensis]
MKVTELAKSLRTTADTVRYYTRLGLLKPVKSVNGYKSYSNKEVSRLKFILSARKLGFSVADIMQIINESEDGKSACPLVRSLIKERLEETTKQFQAMLTLRNKMSLAISQWEKMEDKAPTPHMVCHLIENFEQIEKT